MATIQRKLVHKQFNSPIGLYSEENVKATLDRELRAFSNGTLGIETHDQHKPGNLANSAVLKMLEEEESERVYPGYRKVAWPPVSDSAPIKASTPQPQQPPHQNQYQPPSQHQYQQPYHPSGQQQQQQQSYQPQSQPQYNQPEQQYYHPQAQQPQYQPTDRGQSPGIITLRKEPPISQRPAPVVTSQPAAASFGGGSNMRGDLKWPPPDVKAQMAAENEERIKLAKSPPFRPRRIHKDYTQFFAKHALNNNYPGYKVPPGTQHVYAQF